ncbi:MAG: DNA methyltransferase [Deltaproteobacteria bacterium]|nr:MAG: DNA methyltransferase [Deltaproteobacteria bacterium]
MPKHAVDRQRPSPAPSATFPSTRYQGSKAKLVDWIWERISDLDFVTALDAFGGTGSIAYRLKQAGKEVTYNDLLRFNHYIGRALIENRETRLSSEEVDWLLQRDPQIEYPRFVETTFADIYFTDEENAWIDQTITNIRRLTDPYKYALAFFALSQACIIKRPYNLFHRKNLYMRLADVERSFGNKATWNRPFEAWFRIFAEEANRAVFDNGRTNRSFNLDALDVPGEYDLVYIDTPYISRGGRSIDYRRFYHFLEGLTMYDEWEEHIDRHSKHLPLKPLKTAWTDKRRIHAAFDRLFERYQKSILVVSYRGDGIPSETELVSLLERYKQKVRVEHFGRYRYALSTNPAAREMLLIGM